MRNVNYYLVVILSVWMFIFTCQNSVGQPRFHTQQIGPGGTRGIDLNDSTAIIGQYSGGIFYWKNGTFINLGAQGTVKAINNANCLVGFNSLGIFRSCFDEYSYANLPYGSLPSEAYDINDAGIYVGLALNQDYIPFPFYYDNMLHILPHLPGHSYARASSINNSNVIIGFSFRPTTDEQPGIAPTGVKWVNGVPISLGLPFYETSPIKINNRNVIIVEECSENEVPWAVIMDGASYRHLALLPTATASRCKDINDLNTVIGKCHISTGWQPTIWIDNTAWNINDLISPGSGITITEAVAINNNNEILCYGYYDNPGIRYTYLLSPTNYLTIRDARNDTIPDTKFELYKVANDPPLFTEEYLGKFTTDGKGRFKYETESEDTISFELEEGTRYLDDGDMFKITRQLHNEPSIRHTSALKTMYSIHLDNLKFDDQGIVSFNKVGEDNWSDVVLDHTELRYNLMVSIEWDADGEYHYGLQKDFRAMSNYLYDVADGQLRLDTVMIFDNKDWWHYADVRIRASNMHHPDAVPNAIYVQNAYPVNIPRKWLAGIPGNQQMTHDNFPFNQAYPINYRTLAHEFGHFALNFLDEYQFVNSVGDSLPSFVRCTPRPIGNYGFMDYQYPDPEGGEMASEMSSSYLYTNTGCQNTKQFVFNMESCWDYFEHRFEKEYNGIFAPVRKPDIENETERLTPVGLDYFPGPNNDLLSLDYDVGRQVVFSQNVVAPAPLVGSRLVLVDNVAAGGVNVKLDIDYGTGSFNDPGNFYRTIDQGNTTDLGLLWVLGVNPLYDNVTVTGHSWSYIGGPVALRKSHVLSEVQKQWLFARSGIGAGDTTYITLKPIQGNYPLIFDASVNTVACNLDMYYTQPFNQIPSVKLMAQDKVIGYPAFSTGKGYNANITDSTGESGFIRLSAVDGANHPFSVDVEYTVAKNTDANFTKVIGPLGGVVVSVDSVNAGLEKMMILSSPYPVIRTGLASNAIQAGQAHSVSVLPGMSLKGINNLSVYYSDDDLKIGSNQMGDEADLKMYYWNKNESKWELTGSIVDTELNTVTGSFTEPGVYAAFTNTIVTHSDEGFGLNPPEGFSLSQNYPNPFNQVTEIEFSLPKTSEIKLEIFNINGQLVRTLAANTFNAGKHKVKWNSRDNRGKKVSPGIYLYRLTANEFVETKRMIFHDSKIH